MTIQILSEVVTIKTRKNIIRQIRVMVRKKCASLFNGAKCHLRPAGQELCVFFRLDGQYPEHLRAGKVGCRQFEEASLPIDPDLQSIYFGNHKIVEPSTRRMGSCVRCRTSVIKTSSRHVFCAKCQGKQPDKSTRERMHKKRNLRNKY
jgi:DnaJ-class molecular chaperone